MNAPRTKIFVDAHVFDGPGQGTATFIRGLYSALAQREDLDVYMGASDTGNLHRQLGPGLPISLIRYKSRSRYLRLGYEIPNIIRSYGIDYAHFQYIAPPVKNCRFIVTTHDVIFNDYPSEFGWTYRTMKSLLYGHAARRADLITTVSPFSKDSIEKHLRVKGEKIHVIPNGVEEYFFEDEEAGESTLVTENFGLKKYILYVSRIEPRKNHDLLLKAWLELELYKEGYQLVFVGSKTLPAPRLEQLMKKLPAEVRAYVVTISEADASQLLALYRNASLFVYPSKAEGFGIPPLEAAAMKVPVICSNASAMKAFTFFGDNHIDPQDKELLKQRMIKALKGEEDKLSREELSRTVQREYGWEKPAQLFYELIMEDRKNINREK
jgi:glycosyltransferase involved in cell wall biosynthesis